MYFSKQVLEVLQIFSPCLVLLRQKVFDNVAESFDPDAQGVKRDPRLRPHGTRMQLAGCVPPL